MRPAHSAIEKNLSPLPNRPPEDILREGFGQVGRTVTEYVLDYLLKQARADRILLALDHRQELPAFIARKTGLKEIPAGRIHPPIGVFEKSPKNLSCRQTTGSLECGEIQIAARNTGGAESHTGTSPPVSSRWRFAFSLRLEQSGSAALFFDVPRTLLATWLDTSAQKSRTMLSISLLLDDLKKKRAQQKPRPYRRDENTAIPIDSPCSEELEHAFPEIIGRSRAIENVLRTIIRIADSEIPVLIRGESGTGKELVAAAIHRLSQRNRMPFVCENCGAIAEQLAEAELFGHEKGAFTGATLARPGLIERAGGGTLFLDEVSEMEPGLQKKLLRVLQEKAVRRVGGAAPAAVDFRLVSATNRNLENMVKEKTFREDLYYRLNVASIHIPALRERREDIPLLLDHFVEMYSRKDRQDGPFFSPDIIEALCSYDWPGNIRELGNEIWRLVETVDGEVKPRHLSGKILSNLDSPQDGKNGYLETMEREVLGGAIADALEKTHGNRAQAARLLGIGRTTLYRRLQRYGIRCS